MSFNWNVVNLVARLQYPIEYQNMGITATPVDDYVICPFNARTFPKKDYWVDQLGRRWVMEGSPGVWNMKLPHQNVDFPDIGELVELTFKSTGIRITCAVESIYMQTSSVIGYNASRVCAKATLSVKHIFTV